MSRIVILFCNVKQLVLIKHSAIYTVCALPGGGQLINVARFESIKQKQHLNNLG